MSTPPVVDLRVRIRDLEFANPVGTASGTYGKGLEFKPFYDVGRLGCIVVKTITTEPRAGNPPPRLVESPGGLLNSIGLPNPGVDAYIETILPKLRTLGAPLVINIAGTSIEDFGVLAARFAAEEGVAALELNMSCPNVAHGMDYSTNPGVARQVLERVRGETDLPLIAKLSPNVTDIRPVAEGAVQGGADAISAINTLVGMVIDWRKRKPILGRAFGGLSGPCIKPVALRIVHQLSTAVDVPIIGIGGIQDADDAMEYFLAGASMIQVGTANYYRPTAALDIVEGLPERIASLGASSLAEIVGTLQMP
jgi:dihydroorotate dehydrogenase (NAD+) catalytic subunit